jgi:pimeloyl-ACP methyl ester carboxylesterase
MLHSEPRSFKVSIPQSELDRLTRLVEESRLPEKEILPGAGWDYGVELKWLKSMRKSWLEEFSWREVEETMNKWPQYQVEIDGTTIHYVHERSDDPGAIPLIFSHGWPSSFHEFHKVIDDLAHPTEGQQAFHIIIPSLPGFGFSSPPPRQVWTLHDTATLFDHLMTDVLGYKSYGAVGGDWGGYVTHRLALFPSCKAVHLTLCTVNPPVLTVIGSAFLYFMPSFLRNRLISWTWSPDEQHAFSRAWNYIKGDLGYYIVHNQRPFSLGLAIYDSPMGLLAWMGEKYRDYSDPNYFDAFTRNEMLATVSLYFFTRTIATSVLPYRENMGLMMDREGARIAKPTGISMFPYDILVTPISWIRRMHNVVFYRRHYKGGHFPALDNSEGLAGDIREMMAANAKVFR